MVKGSGISTREISKVARVAVSQSPSEKNATRRRDSRIGLILPSVVMLQAVDAAA